MDPSLLDCVERFAMIRSDNRFIVTIISSRIESTDVSHTHSASHIAWPELLRKTLVVSNATSLTSA